MFKSATIGSVGSILGLNRIFESQRLFINDDTDSKKEISVEICSVEPDKYSAELKFSEALICRHKENVSNEKKYKFHAKNLKHVKKIGRNLSKELKENDQILNNVLQEYREVSKQNELDRQMVNFLLGNRKTILKDLPDAVEQRNKLKASHSIEQVTILYFLDFKINLPVLIC